MIKLAVVDAVVGFVPVAGTIFDIFIRPSRKALDVVHTHIREEYAIQSDIHVVHPYLHEKLEKKQQQSAFWRNPVVSWLWLHIPDLLGAFVLLLIGLAVWWGASYLWGLYQTIIKNKASIWRLYFYIKRFMDNLIGVELPHVVQL